MREHSRSRAPTGAPSEPSRPVACLRRGALLALALLLAVALAAQAWGAPAFRPKQAGPSSEPVQVGVCGETSNLKQGPGATSVEDIALYFGTKALEWSTFKVLDVGFDAISHLTGLDKILGGGDDERIFDELKAIDEKLDGISARLDQTLSLTKEIQKDISQLSLDAVLRGLCDFKATQRTAFNDFYIPWVEKGVELGDALKRNGDAPTPATQAEVAQKKTDLSNLQGAFTAFVVNNNLVSQSENIHNALVPVSRLRTSLLTALGKVVMGNHRYLTSRDSELLLSVYAEFSQVEALASWMSAEYFKTIPSPHAVDDVASKYLAQVAYEQAVLPKVIPEGVVIDVGESPASTNEKPMWFLPTTETKCWLPVTGNEFAFLFPSRAGSPWPRCDEVSPVITALNRSEPEKMLGDGWQVPTMVQLAALMSKDCLADPLNPTKFAPGHAKCLPAGGPGTATVGDYLASLDPMDGDWRFAFCGPTVFGCRQRDLHVWTRDVKLQQMRCGREGFPTFGYSARSYFFYTGYVLDSPNTNDIGGLPQPPAYSGGTNIPGLPRLPDKFPGYDGNISTPIAHQNCDRYVSEIYRGNGGSIPAWFQVPSPKRLGHVIATRYSNAFDLKNPSVGKLDYMAQIVD